MNHQTAQLWRRRCAALLMTSSMLLGMVPGAAAAQGGDGQAVDSLTLQPGETTASLNLNWYAPKGTADAKVKFGDVTVDAAESELTTPTKVDESKYTDTGKIVCKATVTGLEPGKTYEYQISNDGGSTWSKTYTYTAPQADSFTFAFTSDPQIKDGGETNGEGWNPADGTNQTGWAKMMEEVAQAGATLMVSAGDQVEDQSWGKSSEYAAFFAPEEMTSIAYAPAVGNHDRHYMFADHFNLPNEMDVAEDGQSGDADTLEQVKTTFRGQNSGTSQSHGNYIQATESEISSQSDSNGVTPNEEGYYDFTERREMETKGNYYYLYNNVLFVTLNTGAYPGGNDEENAEDPSVPSASKDNSEAEAMVENFRRTMTAATTEYEGQYDWLIVTHHKSTQTVAKHAADSDIENYVDAGFEQVMDEFDVDFVLAGHDHVYSRSYVLKDGERNAEALDTYYDPDGTIYLTGNCASDMQYYTPFEKLDKNDNADYPLLANGETGSEAYLEGNLPYGNQEYNQEYSPSYALFDVEGDTISVNVYNLDGDSENPDSKLIDHFTVTKNADGGEQTQGQENGSAQLDLTKVAGYTSGQFNVDGGVMEIISYNTVTGWAYAVNGQSGLLTAIPLKTLEEKSTVDLLDGNDIDVKALVEAADDGFAYGDMTSVAVSPDGTTLAAALQAEGYADAGRVALFTCNADGSLTLNQVVTVGVQPDMVTFADNNTVLTADEGEPREGYGDDATDPKGSVSVVDVASGEAQVVTFDTFDSQRAALVEAGIVLKKNTAPSVDLEPEYIAVSGGKAYVTLQENNAIAVLDIASKTVTGIYSAGFEDYSTTLVDIDKKDETYDPKTYESLMGIRMPDGIAAFEQDGKTYLLTANEGDSREWGNYLNEDEVNFGKEGKTSPTGAITAENSGLTGKVVFFLSEDYDGLNAQKDYLFGGRSFTLYEITDAGIQEVYTSGSDFERLTAQYFPDSFNTSNDNNVLDDRSGKKGPEAESVTVGTVDGKTYAFVALERTGGVMVYDVTDPANVSYVNYINSRDFTSTVSGSEQYEDGELDKWVTGGDVAPEGFAFVSADNSPTGAALLLTACEVSGTVAVYQLTPGQEQPLPEEDLPIAVISDTHLYDSSELGSTGEAFEDYLNSDRKMLVESEAILDAALEEIAQSDVKYLLIPGDLTKDGEEVNHQLMADKLAAFEAETGIQVFVINGNHDISNANAVRFEGDTTVPVATVDTQEFRSIYAQFGYDEAVAQDPNSLSYTTGHITEVEGIDNFPAYAGQFLQEGMEGLVESMLPAVLMQLDPSLTYEQAVAAAQQMANTELVPDSGITVKSMLASAFAAHYAGDEEMPALVGQIVAQLGQSENPAYQLLASVTTGLYTDAQPGDLNESGLVLSQLPQVPSEGGGSSGGSSTTTTTTTDSNGTVIKVVTDNATGTITTTMEYKNGVTVKAVENSVGVVTADVTVPSGVDSVSVTIPVKNPTNTTVAKVSKTGQVIRTGVAGEDGITVTLTESANLTILDNAKTFSDVSNSQWYADGVNFVTSHEIFAGVGDGTFAPNSTMTRAMLWTVLFGLEGQQSETAGETWYSNAQDWAMKNGVSDGTDPNGSITREQIAVTLYGYAKAQGIAGTVTGDLSKFQDASTVSSWATEAMAWAVQNGLISGKDNGSLAPQDTATRAELAQIMMQFVTASVK